MKLQFTISAQNILHLNQCTWVYVWSWTVAPFQRSRVACKSFGRHKKCVSKVSIFNCSWVSTQIKVFQDWGQPLVVLYLENCLRTYIDMNFSLTPTPLFCVANLLLSRSQWPRGLRSSSAATRLLKLWVRIHRGHGCLSVVCCQVEVSATSWSLVQTSPTDCGASLCVI